MLQLPIYTNGFNMSGDNLCNLPDFKDVKMKYTIRKMFLFMQIRRIYTELGKIIFINMK